MKRNMIVIVIFGLIYFMELRYVTQNAENFQTTDMFFHFTVFPICISFAEGIFGGVVSNERGILMNLIFPIIILCVVYLYLDTVFTSKVILRIYENSGTNTDGVNIVQGIDIGNIISTIIVILSVNIFGMTFGKQINRFALFVKKKVRGNRGENKILHGEGKCF